MPRRSSARRSGSIRHLGKDRWELRFSVDGQRVSKGVRAADRREAERMLGTLMDEHKPADRSSLAPMCRRWLAATAQRKAQRTVEGQETLIRLHIEPYEIGATPLTRIKVSMLEDHYRELGRTRSGQTVRHVHNVINSTLKWAQRRGFVATNVARFVEEMPKINRTLAEMPEMADAQHLFETVEAMGDERFAMFVRLAAVTGARRGELVGLRWGDVNWDRHSIRINRSISELSGGEVIIKETKTRGSRRVLALDAGTQAALYKYLYWAKNGFITDLDHYIFPAANSDGDKPDRPSRYTFAWVTACRQAGVKMRLHDLRHLVASLLLDAGVPVSEVSAQLGHARPSTTFNVYGHLIGDRAAERAAIIAGRLQG